MPKKLTNALSPLQVKNAGPGRYSDGGGLQLLVKPSGARSWVYRFMLAGRTRELGLHPAAGPGAVSLKKARDDADALRRKVKGGVDPLAEREREALEASAAAQATAIAAVTFRAAAETYISAHEESWRNDKHRAQWRNTLEAYVYPVMGDVPVGAIGTAEVMAVLEPIWRTKPETASRVRGRLESVLDAARARGLREGENPARWRGHIAEMLPARTRLSRGHHKAMSYPEVPAFIAKLRERRATAGLAPRGIPHTFRNVGNEPGEHLLTLVPGGVEKMFREVAAAQLQMPWDKIRYDAIFGQIRHAKSAARLAALLY